MFFTKELRNLHTEAPKNLEKLLYLEGPQRQEIQADIKDQQEETSESRADQLAERKMRQLDATLSKVGDQNTPLDQKQKDQIQNLVLQSIRNTDQTDNIFKNLEAFDTNKDDEGHLRQGIGQREFGKYLEHVANTIDGIIDSPADELQVITDYQTQNPDLNTYDLFTTLQDYPELADLMNANTPWKTIERRISKLQIVDKAIAENDSFIKIGDQFKLVSMLEDLRSELLKTDPDLNKSSLIALDGFNSDREANIDWTGEKESISLAGLLKRIEDPFLDYNGVMTAAAAEPKRIEEKPLNIEREPLTPLSITYKKEQFKEPQTLHLDPGETIQASKGLPDQLIAFVGSNEITLRKGENVNDIQTGEYKLQLTTNKGEREVTLFIQEEIQPEEVKPTNNPENKSEVKVNTVSQKEILAAIEDINLDNLPEQKLGELKNVAQIIIDDYSEGDWKSLTTAIAEQVLDIPLAAKTNEIPTKRLGEKIQRWIGLKGNQVDGKIGRKTAQRMIDYINSIDKDDEHYTPLEEKAPVQEGIPMVENKAANKNHLEYKVTDSGEERPNWRDAQDVTAAQTQTGSEAVQERKAAKEEISKMVQEHFQELSELTPEQQTEEIKSNLMELTNMTESEAKDFMQDGIENLEFQDGVLMFDIDWEGANMGGAHSGGNNPTFIADAKGNLTIRGHGVETGTKAWEQVTLPPLTGDNFKDIAKQRLLKVRNNFKAYKGIKDDEK